MDFEVIQGDIAEQSADILVNAAGTSLRMGSGVAGALRRAGGEELDHEARWKGPVDLGEVAVTDAYELDATFVIHAAAMPHYGDGKATPQSIANATRNTLRKAEELGAGSLVIPALGCGVAGFDLTGGARIIAEEIHDHEADSLHDVRFIGYSEEEYETIRAVAENVHPD